MKYKKLSDLTCKIGSGVTPRGGEKAYIEDGKTVLIRSQNIYNHTFTPEGLVYITEEQAEKMKGVEIESNDILMNITGDSVARVTIVPSKYIPSRVNQHVCIIRCKEGIDPYYILAVLTSRNVQRYLVSIAKTGGTRAALTKKMIQNIDIPILPAIDRDRISNIYKIIFEKIELNNQIIDTLEEMASTLFKRWFVDFEFPDENGNPYQSSGGKMIDSELGEIPEGWEIVTIGNLMNNFDRFRIPLSKIERQKRQGHYPYYGAASHMDNVDSFIFDGIYLLLGEDGTVVDPNGYPVLQYIDGKFWVNNHAHVLQGKEELNITTEWLKLWFSHQKVNSIITGAVQPKISQRNLNNMDSLLAKDKVLINFNQIIKPIFNKILVCEKENSKLANLRDTLLPKLLSGEIEMEV